MPSHFAVSDQRYKMIWFKELKDGVVNWLKQNDIKPLEVLLAQRTIAPGALFTHHSNFFFRGLSTAAEARGKGKSAMLATGYSKLEEWQSDGRIEFDFDDEHLTSNSSYSELSGQARKFLLGVIKDIEGSSIRCTPYVIANIVEPSSPLQGYSGAWHNHLEVHVDQIDSFANVSQFNQRLSKTALSPLREVSESDVKQAFAEIINEPVVPNDWGGESSDLFSSRVVLGGKRVSTAFLLKGPAKFHVMTPADLGKNGDQIGRLFNEPADLLVLQHCHEVTPAVRKQMRAYAQQMGNPRQFCVIDG